MPIKTRLQRERIRSGLMQVELAKRAGISLSMLSRYENGWAVPGKVTARKIAKVLDTDVEGLFREDTGADTVPDVPLNTKDPVSVPDAFLEEVLGKPEDAMPREKQGSHIKTVHVDDAIEVLSMDRPGPGGLCHQYEFYASREEGLGMAVGSIHFQEGRVAEVGVNGLQHEALMSIMIDRLRTLYASRRATEQEKCALMYLLKAREAMTTEIEDD